MRVVLMLALLSSAAALADPPAGQAAPTASEDSGQVHTNHLCLHETGSRIHRAPGECIPAFGSSYGRDDFDNNGASTVPELLRDLDTTVVVHR